MDPSKPPAPPPPPPDGPAAEPIGDTAATYAAAYYETVGAGQNPSQDPAYNQNYYNYYYGQGQQPYGATAQPHTQYAPHAAQAPAGTGYDYYAQSSAPAPSPYASYPAQASPYTYDYSAYYQQQPPSHAVSYSYGPAPTGPPPAPAPAVARPGAPITYSAAGTAAAAPVSVTGKFQLKPQLSASAVQQQQQVKSQPPAPAYASAPAARQPALAPPRITPIEAKRPAYTPVPPAQPPPGPASGASKAAAAAAGTGAGSAFGAVGSNFPPALKAYLDRCLASVGARPADRTLMMKQLKDAITRKMQLGQMWSTDWDREPILTLPDLNAVRREEQAGRGPVSSRVAFHEAPADSPKNAKKRKWEAAQAKKKGALKGSVHARLEVQRDSDSDLDEAERLRRARRFGPEKGRRKRVTVDSEDDDDFYEGAVIVGTCQDLEKSYFRLQAAPDPATVRPQAVLERALDRLLGLLQGGRAKVDYFYVEDQFKGIRQDCTIQHIRNAFTVKVYEAHARAALDYGDLGEFNQCQTQLITLYADNHPGATVEFHAYRLLYGTVNASKGLATEIARALRATTPALKARPEVQHALRVRAAVFQGDYSAFFRLYQETPNRGQRILETILEPVRFETVKRMAAAYKPALAVGLFSRALLFEALEGQGDEGPGRTACLDWMEKHGAVVKDGQMDCAATLKTLFMPVNEDAVAHGDANLSLDKFLTALLH